MKLWDRLDTAYVLRPLFNLGRHPVQTHILNQIVYSHETGEREAFIKPVTSRTCARSTPLGDNYGQEALQGAFNTATKRLTYLLAWIFESATSFLRRHGYNSWVCPMAYVSSLASRTGTMMRRAKPQNSTASSLVKTSIVVEDHH